MSGRPSDKEKGSMDMQTCPIFDANSALYQNLGLLKVAETAARKHGDLVILHTRDDRDTYLVTGERSLDFWRQHAGHLAAEFGDVTSSAMTMRLLLGENTEEASWARIGLPMRRKLAGLSGPRELWFNEALVRATAAFLDDAVAPVTDLRALCRLWAVRVTCHPIFGTAVSDQEMADGIAQVQVFHRFMFNRNADAFKDADALEEFRRTRAFLDDTVRAGIAAARLGENTILARLLEAMPDDIRADDRIDHLRPLLFRILFERLGVDGLSLLWALVHLAQDPDLADAIANDAPEVNGAPGLATAVALETQRLYPELPFLYRTTSRDLDFGAITISAQATLLFSPFLLHRDERLWDEPTRFDPSRFRNGGHPDHFLPFGLGLNARRQTDNVTSQIAAALTNICGRFRFELPATCAPGNLRPFLRSKLMPRGVIPFDFIERVVCRESEIA